VFQDDYRRVALNDLRMLHVFPLSSKEQGYLAALVDSITMLWLLSLTTEIIGSSIRKCDKCGKIIEGGRLKLI
jgi:hypothetical protein